MRVSSKKSVAPTSPPEADEPDALVHPGCGPIRAGFDGPPPASCRYIKGNVKGRALDPEFYCGCPCLPGTAWCAEHRAIVYRPVTERQLEQKRAVGHASQAIYKKQRSAAGASCRR